MSVNPELEEFHDRLVREEKEDPNNAKVHTDTQISIVAKSIEEFGFNDPIGIRPDDFIVEGHSLRLAALELGMTEVPILILHGFDEREYQLYAIAHNRITLQTPHDTELLRQELTRIFVEGDQDFDYALLGFNEGHSNWAEVNRGAPEDDHCFSY